MSAAEVLPAERDGCPDGSIGSISTQEVRDALLGRGVRLDIGLAVIRLRSDVPSLAAPLQAAYRNFPLVTQDGWADLHVDLVRPLGLRRWLWPQALFRSDGQLPFQPFPSDTALPLFEWGANWLIGQRLNDSLLFHAGVLERDGFALVLPAMPGSGKSTLTAALSLRGWRLLSDEFGAYSLGHGSFQPVLKPVALKNESIAVIREFATDAQLGPEFPKTRKGTVAHLAPPKTAVTRRHEHAQPGAIVLPKWQSGISAQWVPLEPQTAFSALAFNAFNYPITGAAGFRAVVGLVRQCPAWQLVYSELEDAIALIDSAWVGIPKLARDSKVVTKHTHMS